MKTNYQVFISFKNSDDITEEDTLDKEIAHKIYTYLTDRRLNVFFSPITLKALGQDNWSEEIDSALKQSKIFIAVGTKKEHMNAKFVKEERTKFVGLKLDDKSRAIYGYIASPMRLKDLPDDMKQIEVFQDKKSDAIDSLYTYVCNHLARVENRDIKKETKINKNYLLAGVLFLVGIFFFNNNEDLVEIIREERLEDKKIIEEQKKDKEKDNQLLLVYKTEIELLRQELKNYPEKLKEIEEEAKKISKSKGLEASLYFLKNIDLNNYKNISTLSLYASVEDDINSTLITYYASHGIWQGNGSLISSETNFTPRFKYNFMNYWGAELQAIYDAERNNNFTYQSFFTFEENVYSDDLNSSYKF